MVYVVKWTEQKNNQTVKRKIVVAHRPLAVIMLNRLIVDCHHYDTVLIEKEEKHD